MAVVGFGVFLPWDERGERQSAPVNADVEDPTETERLKTQAEGCSVTKYFSEQPRQEERCLVRLPEGRG